VVTDKEPRSRRTTSEADGRHTGKIAKASLCFKGDDGALRLRGVRGDDQVMCATWRSRLAGHVRSAGHDEQAGQPQARAGGRGVADRGVVAEQVLAGGGRYEDGPSVRASRDRAGTGTRGVTGARDREAGEPQARDGSSAVGDRGRRPDAAAMDPADRAVGSCFLGSGFRLDSYRPHHPGHRSAHTAISGPWTRPHVRRWGSAGAGRYTKSRLTAGPLAGRRGRDWQDRPRGEPSLVEAPGPGPLPASVIYRACVAGKTLSEPDVRVSTRFSTSRRRR